MPDDCHDDDKEGDLAMMCYERLRLEDPNHNSHTTDRRSFFFPSNRSDALDYIRFLKGAECIQVAAQFDPPPALIRLLDRRR